MDRKPWPADAVERLRRLLLVHRCRECGNPLPKDQVFCDDRCREEFEETNAW